MLIMLIIAIDGEPDIYNYREDLTSNPFSTSNCARIAAGQRSWAAFYLHIPILSFGDDTCFVPVLIYISERHKPEICATFLFQVYFTYLGQKQEFCPFGACQFDTDGMGDKDIFYRRLNREVDKDFSTICVLVVASFNTHCGHLYTEFDPSKPFYIKCLNRLSGGQMDNSWR